MHIGRVCVGLIAPALLLQHAADAEDSSAVPSKVTLLVDSELPVPFAVVDSVQPVKAGTEVNVKAANGDQIRVSYGVAEGLVSMEHTDFAERAKKLSVESPKRQGATPQYYKPYDRDIVVERVTAEEVELRQAKAAEQRRIAQEEEERSKKERENEIREDQEKEKQQKEKEELERAERETEAQRIATEKLKLQAQVQALDAQISAAQSRVNILNGRLSNPNAGVEIVSNGKHSWKDVRERAAIEWERRIAIQELSKLQEARSALLGSGL